MSGARTGQAVDSDGIWTGCDLGGFAFGDFRDGYLDHSAAGGMGLSRGESGYAPLGERVSDNTAPAMVGSIDARDALIGATVTIADIKNYFSGADALDTLTYAAAVCFPVSGAAATGQRRA